MESKPAGVKNITYLGDAVYIGVDGRSVVLYTTDGIQVQNIIYLEDSVITAFETWLEGVRKSHE